MPPFLEPRTLFRWSCTLWWATACTFFLSHTAVQAELNNDTSPTHQFKSRPDLHAPIIELALYRPHLLEPGYVFLAPYRNIDPGPYIYANDGTLVWSGAGHSGPRVAHTPRVCRYHGEDHLCFFTGEQHQGFSRGHGVIMDKRYRTVKTVEAAGAGASADMHEFKMTPFADGRSALLTVYQPRQYDLTANPRFNVEWGMGWVVEGVFQEVEIDTGRLLFEWRSLDHVDPGDAWTMPHTTDTSGDGLDERTPWDYFHLNSVDKNAEGDYLISARHTSAVYKVSGRDGAIVWTLGGVRSDFDTSECRFAYQHHARWLSETRERTVLSMFDNGSNGFNHSAEFSHGFIVEINHVTKKATIERKWGAPDLRGGLQVGSQGAMQLLPGGNVHIGWGEWAWFSEHTWDGKPALYAKVASRSSNVMIYRTSKYNWTAQPVTKPALWTYSKFGNDTDARAMVFYVSWNGATEVASWSFFTSDSAAGPWTFVVKAQKEGFETVHRRKSYSRWAWAQALDGEGRVLADSVIARTFVPSETLRAHCGEDGCDVAVPVEIGNAGFTAYEERVDVDPTTLSTNRGFDTENYYYTNEFRPETGYVELADEDGYDAEEVSYDGLAYDYGRHDSNENEYHFAPPDLDDEITSWGGYGNSNLSVLLFGIVTGYVASMCMNFVRSRDTHTRSASSV